MEQIEFQGKKYEWTSRRFTLRRLFEDAYGCPDAARSIHLFWYKYLPDKYPWDNALALTPRRVDWLTTDSDQHIPWLVEKGYLKEVAEEVKLVSGQWYIFNGSLCLGVRDHTAKKNFMISMDGNVILNDIKHFTRTPSPTITEQPDKTERYSVSCVHHKNTGCLNNVAIKHFGTKDSVSCHNRIPDSCPAYNDGKSTERSPEKCVHNRLPEGKKTTRWCNNYRVTRGGLTYCDTDQWKNCDYYSEE